MKNYYILSFFPYLVSLFLTLNSHGLHGDTPAKQADAPKRIIEAQPEMRFVNGVSNLATNKDINVKVEVLSLEGFKEQCRITELRGQPQKLNLAEADGPKDSLPLILWFNGGPGPGCSSLGVGATEKLGPFRVISSDWKMLYENENAWNKGQMLCSWSHLQQGWG
uniref:Uncharacterized protein n=1 Tax=Nelumbo nucifera TaxID=4432 RepID=A0A822ZHF0_NELNU|nr:TPA_asm: hypothetical protein HUJ06_000696 [Nelumbo nucifera]